VLLEIVQIAVESLFQLPELSIEPVVVRPADGDQVVLPVIASQAVRDDVVNL
jgi:hypothetical protein